MEDKPRLGDSWVAVATIAENHRAIEEFGIDEFVRRAFPPEEVERYGFDNLLEQVQEVVDRIRERSDEEYAKDETEILDREGLTPEDLEEERREELVLGGRVVIMQTLDIDTERAWELNDEILERLELFYSFERPRKLLEAAIDPSEADLKIDDQDVLDRAPVELLKEVVEDPTLFEKQREAAVEIVDLLVEYGEEVDRWVHEEGLDQLAAEQAGLRMLTEAFGPRRSGKKEQHRLERKAKRKAKRKGKN